MEKELEKSIQDKILEQFFVFLRKKEGFTNLSENIVGNFTSIDDISSDELFMKLISFDSEVNSESC